MSKVSRQEVRLGGGARELAGGLFQAIEGEVCVPVEPVQCYTRLDDLTLVSGSWDEVKLCEEVRESKRIFEAGLRTPRSCLTNSESGTEV